MVLKRVDPNAPHNLLKRGLIAFGRTPVGRAYGMELASRADPFLLRHSGGRLRLAFTMPTALLRTTGAKSGVARERPILYFHDGSDVILIASSFEREKHPSWFHNLKANPGCALNGDPYVADEVMEDAERDRLFGLGVRVYEGYADYKVRTDAIGRRIPILRLTPTSR